MSWNLITDELTTSFSPSDVNLIRESFGHAVEWTKKFLEVDNVDAHFYVYKNFGPWGVGACAPGPDRLNLCFHPENFLLGGGEYSSGPVRLSAVVAHESHHIMRWRGPGYGTTLGEAMVSEGLALKFQRETQHPDFPDERYLQGNALLTMSEKAKTLLDEPPGTDRIFRDRQGSLIDYHVLGLALVEGWAKYSGLTAASSYNIPAQEVLGPWRRGKYDISSSVPCPR